MIPTTGTTKRLNDAATATVMPGDHPGPVTNPPSKPTTTSTLYEGCDLGDRLVHVASMTTANILAALAVGNAIHKRTQTWILPALGGAVSGQIAASLVGIGLNKIRNRRC